jgi:epoxyqueuosine reductase
MDDPDRERSRERERECSELTRRLKAEANRLGFEGIGIAPAVSPPGYGQFLEWLSHGYAASMGYLERLQAAREHPSNILDGVRSVVMVSLVYGQAQNPARSADVDPRADRHGQVARYAQGADYHRVFWDRLEALLGWLRGERPDVRGRAISDTAPLLERDFARLAGLGWIGKNTMLIHKKLGSFTLLGALLVDLELDYDSPQETNHCGTCTRCLDACPTDAFAGPHQLDARRCISYWTIEHKGPIGAEFAGPLNGWVFGCDICQDVCPWNRKAPASREAAFEPRPEWSAPDLIEWLNLSLDGWRARLAGTSLKRAKRSGLLRNAAIVLGERRVAEAVPALAARLADDREDPVVRASAAWALGRIGGDTALAILDTQSNNADRDVADAARSALAVLENRLEPSASDAPMA